MSAESAAWALLALSIALTFAGAPLGGLLTSGVAFYCALAAFAARDAR